ncbi:class I SAM-dependent methyltransferase [Haloferula chungangensis]|uniref:Class I SAM-dependent methyltransferase n=1 Tax=Haloferula chungangensis TaxID=1048331 RepID=A0ABW2LD24_9BACT
MIRIISFLLLATLLPLAAQSAPRSGEESVKPGINTRYLDPELQVDEWLKRFEVESREVFHKREEILKACGIKPGMKVADIGAGTGLYTRLFSNAVGEQGWVYAVDINGRFLEHIQARAAQEKQNNITTVLCPQDSISLPPASIDFAFLCDVYHHFEFPKTSLASLHQALKPGGRIILIDFIRIDGVSNEWTLNHVRAGEDVFRQEFEDAGFRFEARLDLPGLKENYCLHFVKPE